MNLYILRHGEAEAQADSGGDDARRLTLRGKEKVRAAAAGMRAYGLRFAAILTSPLPRAAETADIVAAAYANDPPPQVVPALAAGVPPADAIAALGPLARHDSLLIVGHEPQLGMIASMLLSGGGDAVHVRLKKGACVALELPGRFERASAELCWMMTQRQLRRLRK
jgi:phosphohistidine phosphatase